MTNETVFPEIATITIDEWMKKCDDGDVLKVMHYTEDYIGAPTLKFVCNLTKGNLLAFDECRPSMISLMANESDKRTAVELKALYSLKVTV